MPAALELVEDRGRERCSPCWISWTFSASGSPSTPTRIETVDDVGEHDLPAGQGKPA
ncbi:hypothetical protein HBB16_11810 [Pseudonocardia sp. MCCB 268]|nr:hypothetical protein [Pseudonocardia cytotoxica]